MKLVSFVANNAAQALAEVHKRLGPDAVIVSVRRLPAPGLARIWNKQGQIEVTAGVPDKTSAPKVDNFSLPQDSLIPPSAAQSPQPSTGPATGDGGLWTDNGRWQSVAWLETMGLLPVNAERLQTHLRAVQGDAPDSPEEEWKIVSAALSRFWLNPPPLDEGPARPHVFIGPPGSGKTTALCKWLTLAALLEERAARVWRLDGTTANTADFLAIHCEMLGVPLERFWTNPGSAGELWFVDLPGVEIADEMALTALRNQLATLPSPRVHLVLNAAYEMSALLAQWRAFAACQPEDLIFTHLDEEARRVKLWNFVFGTNCSLRFLGAGQKIPGEFRSASPEILFPAKTR
jgi:flagellar biosynthesis protein FlhF